MEIIKDGKARTAMEELDGYVRMLDLAMEAGTYQLEKGAQRAREEIRRTGFGLLRMTDTSCDSVYDQLSWMIGDKIHIETVRDVIASGSIPNAVTFPSGIVLELMPAKRTLVDRVLQTIRR